MAEPVTGIIGAVGAIGSAVGANKQAKSAKNAANAQAEIGRELAALAREQWENYKTNYQPYYLEQLESEKALRPTREAAIRTGLESQIEDRQFYEDTYRPIESRLANEVDADYREQAAGDAAANVDRQFGIQREAQERRNAQYGIRPDSGRYASINRNFDIQNAAERANASNTARRAEYTEGLNRKMAVLGRGAPLRTLNAPNTIPLTQSQIDPSGIGGIYSGAGQNLGHSARTSGGLADMYARDAGGITKGLAQLFGRDGGFGFGNQSGTFESGGYGPSTGMGMTNDYGYEQPASYAHGGLIRNNMPARNAKPMMRQPMVRQPMVNTPSNKPITQQPINKPMNGGGKMMIGIPGRNMLRGFSDGGDIAQGMIDGPGSETSDSINGIVEDGQGNEMPARFSKDEYVIPADVVRMKGVEFFDNLVNKYHQSGNPGLKRG